jgi:hypothetical protein
MTTIRVRSFASKKDPPAAFLHELDHDDATTPGLEDNEEASKKNNNSSNFLPIIANFNTRLWIVVTCGCFLLVCLPATVLIPSMQQQQQQQQQQHHHSSYPQDDPYEEYPSHDLGEGEGTYPVTIYDYAYAYDNNVDTDGPPKDLVVHGKRDFYTPCPPAYRKRAYISITDSFNLHRAFRFNGWAVTTDPDDVYAGEAHILFRRGAIKHWTSGLQPWQRFSRIPGFVEHIDSKDGFVAGFRRLQARHHKMTGSDENLIYFLPETYRLGTLTDRISFAETLKADSDRSLHRPWVLKKTHASRGRGVEMLPPQSKELHTAIERSMADKKSNYIVQAYVCNELTWFGGEKFDLRFYWMVASVDPIVVLYHDGFVRVGEAAYNETDFGSTQKHLTNSAYSVHEDEDVLADALWRRVRQHYEANRARLAPRIVGNDPVRHVRNQLKEAISTTVEAFKDVFLLTKYPNVTTENLFALYGCDFIIDRDLDVYYVEAQDGPQMKDTHDFRVDLYRRMLRPMINIVEEIAIKQEKDAQANLLPLKSLGEWEVVYAGDWRYRFEGYERSKNKKGCSL